MIYPLMQVIQHLTILISLIKANHRNPSNLVVPDHMT